MKALKMEMQTVHVTILIMAVSALTFLVNYGFALMGEPRSVWLMQTLGIF